VLKLEFLGEEQESVSFLKWGNVLSLQILYETIIEALLWAESLTDDAWEFSHLGYVGCTVSAFPCDDPVNVLFGIVLDQERLKDAVALDRGSELAERLWREGLSRLLGVRHDPIEGDEASPWKAGCASEWTA